VITLAGNLDFAGPRFLTGLTAVFLARLRYALAWKVCTLSLLVSGHRGSPFLYGAGQRTAHFEVDSLFNWSLQKSIRLTHQKCGR
jgi:hypothetical protein